jgi:hypothetical protein
VDLRITRRLVGLSCSSDKTARTKKTNVSKATL